MLKHLEDYIEIASKRYKYKCIRSFKTYTLIKGYDIDHKYFRLFSDGLLIIKKGYACDGASGPTIDDETNIHAGFIHDVLYQMLRLGLIGYENLKRFNKVRKLSDKSFYNQLKKDGMFKVRAYYYYLAVRWFGEKHALPE